MPANYDLFCTAVGILLFIDWLNYIPLAKIYFGPGYGGDGWAYRTRTRRAMFELWGLAALALAFGVGRLPAALMLTLIFRYHFIATRWSSVFRGGGAPGFISHYLALVILIFEASAALDASGRLPAIAGKLYRADLGMILFCSGTYKALAGYLQGEGMEYGIANPMWGYFHARFKKLRPRSAFLAFQNGAAVLGEWFIGLALFVSLVYEPAAAWAGAALIVSFAYTVALIRLGRLGFLMIAAALPLLPDLGWVGAQTVRPGLSSPDWAVAALGALMTGYIALLPAVKIKQYLNLFANKRFPEPFETALSRFANAVPIVIWRVFTADVTNFFVRIYETGPSGQKTVLLDEKTGYSYSHWKNPRLKHRFLQVTESIVLTSVFTTLKYFESDRAQFERKLVRYARTLGVTAPAGIKFQYVAIRKKPDEFEYAPVCEFDVDLESGEVRERKLDPDFSYHAKARFSPVRESAGHGTYTKKNEPNGKSGPR